MTRQNRVAILGMLASLASVAAGAGEAPAQDAQGIDYILRAGLSYSDNLFRAPSGSEQAVGAVAVGAEMRGKRDTGRLNYDVAVDLSRYQYFENYDGQTFGRALLDGSYAFVPDTLFWNARFDFDQFRDDLTRPLAPGNIDNQIAFSTGPEARLRLGSVMEAQGEAHYQFVRFSQSNLDSSTVGGRALLGRRANPRSFLAVGASADKVSYDDDVLAQAFDYDRSEAFARFEHTGQRTGVSAEAGYAKVSGATVDDSGPLFRGNIWRRLTPTLRGEVSYVREYPTSSATSFMTDPTVPGGGTVDNTILTAAPRVSQNLDANLSMTRTRTQALLAYSWHRDSSLIPAYGDRDYNEIRFRVSRQFTPKASGTFFAAYSTEDYTNFPDEFEDTTVGGILTILFGRSLGLDLRVEHHDRNATTAADAFKELSWGLFVRYSGAFGRRASLEEDIGLR
jgi:hypothetical protein